MKNLFIFTLVTITFSTLGQSIAVQQELERVGLNYIEGFYEGDTTKLATVLMPSLHKFGYWQNEKTGDYGEPIYMTFQGAMDYANKIKQEGKFAKPSAPKKVEILDVMDHIAAIKVSAWWGYDYMLLAKHDGQWMIEEILWQGPYKPVE